MVMGPLQKIKLEVTNPKTKVLDSDLTFLLMNSPKLSNLSSNFNNSPMIPPIARLPITKRMFPVLNAIFSPIKSVDNPKACITIFLILSGSFEPINKPKELPNKTVPVLTKVPIIRISKAFKVQGLKFKVIRWCFRDYFKLLSCIANLNFDPFNLEFPR